eukprot:TRINITY_DN73559_c0_g1_i1.p1 TRINITY_DN73559_c0_g1~~TRINITY_DN73559_c0_g1_i1.p1  ORF type:complete len:203 (+),score=37.99 TRINITY_DN73559_c0_g1_i1:176-784(+)
MTMDFVAERRSIEKEVKMSLRHLSEAAAVREQFAQRARHMLKFAAYPGAPRRGLTPSDVPRSAAAASAASRVRSSRAATLPPSSKGKGEEPPATGSAAVLPRSASSGALPSGGATGTAAAAASALAAQRSLAQTTPASFGSWRSTCGARSEVERTRMERTLTETSFRSCYIDGVRRPPKTPSCKIGGPWSSSTVVRHKDLFL